MAAEVDDYVNFEAPFSYYYQSDFDILTMDFVVPDNGGAKDVLSAITVKNKGTAQVDYQIDKVRIYADDGSQGFQGIGVDKDLGEAVWYPNEAYWYLENINEEIPVGGLRIFISVETTYVLTTSYSLDFYIPALSDLNADGRFDLGEKGVFVESENDGPVGDNLLNSTSQIISRLALDNIPPVVVIDNIKNGETVVISGSGDILITGLARDRAGSFPSWVKVSIDGEWFDAESTGTYFDTWQYLWSEVALGSHVIAVKSADFIGNEYTSPSISMEADGRAISLALVETEDEKISVGEKATIDVWLQDDLGEAIAGKKVILHSSKKDYDTIEAITDITDENGLAKFSVSSNVFGSSLYFAEVDEKLLTWNIFNAEIPVSAVVEFVSDKSLSGRLIKSPEDSTVYLLGVNNQRYVFPNEKIFFSWYDDFSNVELISSDGLSQYPLVGNIKYKPGSLIKMPSVPKVYLVDDDQNLRWIETETVAKILFSLVWSGRIDDMSEAFFSDYTESDSISENKLNISPFQSLLNQ